MYKPKKTNFENVSLSRQNTSTYIHPCFKYTYRCIHIIQVFVVTLPSAPSRSDILGLPPPSRSDQNVLYVFSRALDEV
jgi:hypothetical protein